MQFPPAPLGRRPIAAVGLMLALLQACSGGEVSEPLAHEPVLVSAGPSAASSVPTASSTPTSHQLSAAPLSGCQGDADWHISKAPVDVQIAVGETASFSVNAEGAGGLFEYQWLRDGEAIDGATQSQYSFVSTIDDGGAVFSVKVRPRGAPICQEKESSPATLGWRGAF